MDKLEKYIYDNYRYDPETGKLSKGSKIVGSENSYGYINILVQCKSQDIKIWLKAHRIAWFIYYGEFPQYDIDHINGIKSDNRIVNLRQCNDFQNQANAKKPKNNSSGFKGVYFDKDKSKWRARIMCNNKRISIGLFDNAIDAAKAYNQKAIELCAEFANILNL